jgi:ABC-type transport system involved in multi-copper enzyme maturation permease subunit
LNRPLIGHSFARFRTVVIVMAILLSAFQVLMVLAAATLHRSGTFSQLGLLVPPIFRQVFGDSLLVFMSFSGIVAFGYFHPMIVAALVGLVIAVATEPAAEIETRFLDVILSRPLARRAIVARSVVLLVFLPAAVLAAMLVGTTLGLRFLAPTGIPLPGARLIGSLALNTWALLLAIGGVTLAATTLVRRRTTVAGAAALTTFALFLADYLSRVWAPARRVAWLSPFHYSDAMALIMGRSLPGWHVLVLVAAAACGVGAAHLVFSRRDL